ncbi:MAG: choice-of-anchor D domain-containing protein [Acidobacteriia bacterium]|nr:choice-of-anchor D domain-containing protein [Terriglobia bacterium]
MASQIQQATAGGTFNLPNTNVGASAQFTVVITNTGSAAAQINAITAISPATDGAYSVSFPVGVTFPIMNFAPGQTLSFTLTFAPPVPGDQSGKLQVNIGTATPAELDTITLKATAIGAQLAFSVQVAGTTTQLANNATILFSNTAIGTTSLATISIANTGNADGTINQISVSPTPPYTLNPPSLPLKVPANGKASFTVSFAPQSTGAASGTLKVDTASFVLQGTGNPPQALPAIAFTNAPSTVSPQSQPAVGLTLGAAYPLDLSGTLTLTFVSNSFVDDPTIQFSTGARTVTFTIPANTTSAIFGQNQTNIAFQTGTVAGVISIQAALAIGTVNVTPSPAPATSITIAAAAPQIQSLTIGAKTSDSVTLVMTGFSTPRDMSKLSLHFVSASGYTIQTPDLSTDVSSNFSTWYQSGASQPFGSQFSLAFQIGAFSGSITGVQSVTATVSNSAGVSNPATISLQ